MTNEMAKKPTRNPMRIETAPTFDEIKAWVRQEIDLSKVGVDEEERKEQNP